ncbi:alpha/beta hydrolase [Nocardia sp. NPDC058058]|uniref:alpha/beta hydrolase n=1 Tax=Nocardia sp. NPDC058058 TaxID=3346317 RepID=UPI0036DE7545
MHSSYLAFLPAGLLEYPDVRPESTFWRWRDRDIHLERVHRPEASVRMLLIHGGGGHAAALWPFAALAAERGFEVVTPDLPGYGATRVPAPSKITYPDWVDCVTDLVRAEHAADDRPLIVVGASMGGMLAYEAAARTGLVAAVVATCLLDMRLPQARAAVGRHPRLANYAARLLLPAFDRLRVPMRWLADMNAISNDPALTKLIVADTLGGGVAMPLGFLRTYLHSAPAIEPEDFTACPVWLTHPGADHWTPLAVSRSFFDRIAAPKTLLVLPDSGHYPIETPGLEQLARAFDEVRAYVDGAPFTGREP